MNQVEFTMLTSMISNMKHQLAAFETVLATIANVKKDKSKTSTVPKPIDPNDDYMSADEEDEMLKELEVIRQRELKRMEASAENFFTKTMQDIADGSSNPGPT